MLKFFYNSYTFVDFWNSTINMLFKIAFFIEYYSTVFLKDDLSTWTLFKYMAGWFCIWFFLENKTSSTGLIGSGLKSIFQLKANLELNCRSSLRISALSFLSLTIVKRDVLIHRASHWCRPEKRVDLKLNLGKHLLKLVSKMTFVHLKSSFGVCLLDSFQEGYKVLQRCPYS